MKILNPQSSILNPQFSGFLGYTLALTPVQFMNFIFAGVSLSYKDKRMLSVQEKELCIFGTTTTN